MRQLSFKRHRFPADIIRYSIWLYARFTLSFRDVEEMLVERDLDVSYETVRRWFLKFGSTIAANLRRTRPRPSDHWHLDEMVIVIQRKRYWLWRAVDNEGEVLDVLVQRRRDAKAARKFMKKLLKKQSFAPSRVVTDKLRSYASAFRSIGLAAEHDRSLKAKKTGRDFPSTGSPARTQAPKVQFTRRRTTISLPALRNLQHFLPPASPPQTTHVQGPSNHIVRRLASRERGRLTRALSRHDFEPLWFM
jgi:putative transposase